MDNKTKVVYVLNVSNYELDIQYSAGVYSNIDLAMKKVLDGVSDDMVSFNTLLDFAKIACASCPTDVSHPTDIIDSKDASHPSNVLHSDNNGNTTYSKDVVDSVTAILKMVVNYVLDDVDYEISEELFSKVQHLIQNPEQYNQQDLYDEFLSYLYHWTQLFKHFCVTCDDFDHIQAKIKQIADGYQELHIVQELPDFDNVNFTFEQLKQRYPNISFSKYSFKHNENEFDFSIYDYWNMETKHDSYNIVRFVLDE